MHLRFGRLAFAAGLSFAALSLAPGEALAQNPVHWALKPAAGAPTAPGAKTSATLSVEIDAGWHVYALTQPPGGPHALELSVKKTPALSLASAITGPVPIKAFDPNFNMDTLFHEEKNDWTIPVAVAKTAGGGKNALSVTVSYQTCNERLCLPPAEETLSVDIEVDAPVVLSPASKVQSVPLVRGPESPVVTAPTAPSAATAPVPTRRVVPDLAVASSKATSFPSYVLLAMLMGALSLLTPCVFPMVPITVSYFTARAGRTRREAVTQALVYGAGIILTFSAVGLALALFLGASGLNQFAANPWVNLGITALFLGFALSLFGGVNVALPSSIVTKAVTAERGRSQFVGTLLMGFAFTLTSFTCTAPFLGSLLVVAATGDWQWPLAGMLAFSSVFALPFVILAIVPQRLAALPRAGAWMQQVKTSMGLLEVAAAMKFLSNVDLVWGWGIFTRTVVLGSWVIVAILLVWQFVRPPRTAPKWVLAAASLALAVWLGMGMRGLRMGELEAFLPPAEASVLAAGKELEWVVNDYEKALAEAKQHGRPIMIDFTGYTCTNCRWMEANMFPRPDVAVELARYVRVRLYTDGQGEPYRGFQNMQRDIYGTVALPYYVAVNADGTPSVAFGGLTRDPAEFISFLRKGLE
jgi:thiol:disulfide interchange protein